MVKCVKSHRTFLSLPPGPTSLLLLVIWMSLIWVPLFFPSMWASQKRILQNLLSDFVHLALCFWEQQASRTRERVFLHTKTAELTGRMCFLPPPPHHHPCPVSHECWQSAHSCGYSLDCNENIQKPVLNVPKPHPFFTPRPRLGF